MEHRSLRYTWELVRHTYLVDLEKEMEIRLVEVSPSHENRLLDPPYPFTAFFEIEIDQIQKNGSTVFSLRNICPVQINQKTGLNFLNSLIKGGSSRVTKRFQHLDGETETRWIYTDDFFLISLSSGDRHDLEMLSSLIIGKLNMIALSIQSGKRIQSEFENQEKFRTVMSAMFSEGVDGAFRDVPVYRQHGDMTESDIDVSATLMSAEFQDLLAVCSSGEGAVVKTPVAEKTHTGVAGEGKTPAKHALRESMDAEPAPADNIPYVNPAERITERSTLTEIIPDTCTLTDTEAETTPVSGCIPEDVPQGSFIPEENTRIRTIPEGRCGSCGAGISSTKKFCGNCGAAVSIAPPQESGSDLCGSAGNSDGASSSVPTPAAEQVVNLKSIKELEDLSWLSD